MPTISTPPTSPYTPFCISTINTLAPIHAARKGYFRFISRETCWSREEIAISWLIDHGCKGFLDIPKATVYEYYFEEQSFLQTLRELLERMLQDTEGHLSSYTSRKQHLLEAARRLSALVKLGNKTVILQQYQALVQWMYVFGDWIWGAWAVIYHLEKEVLELFPQQKELIISLEEPTDYQTMQEELLEHSPEHIAAKYGWLKIYSPHDEPYTEKELISLKSSLLSDKGSDKQIDHQAKAFAKNKKEFASFLATIDDDLIKNKVQLVHAYAFLKTDRIDAWRRVMRFLRPFYEFLAHQHHQQHQQQEKYAIQDVVQLAVQEIVQFLSQGTAPDIQQLQKRTRHQALYFMHDHIIEILTDQRTMEKVVGLLEGQQIITGEISGTIAYIGKAQGKVKIITSSQDLNKIKEGDVLVARYTFPSFTPAMARAAAIVTDEGGLTSHAAIVSRELKKPCIVGTKIATQVLKDGDMVEVDAEQGKVNILKAQ